MKQLTKKQRTALASLLFAGHYSREITNVAPASNPYLNFEGSGVKTSASVIEINLDLSYDRRLEKTALTVVNLTQENILVWIEGRQQYLEYLWETETEEVTVPKNGGKVSLDLGLAVGMPFQKEIQENVVIVAEMQSTGARNEYHLRTNVKIRVEQPLAVLSFNGALEEEAHDFGFIAEYKPLPKGRQYKLEIENIGETPLHIKPGDMPKWLSVWHEGQPDKPNPSEFHIPPQHKKVLTLTPILQKNQFGYDCGLFTLTTNDERPEYRVINIPFSLIQNIESSSLFIETPMIQDIVSPGTFTTNLHIKNWEQTPQTILIKSRDTAPIYESEMQIPSGNRLKPGVRTVPVQIESCDFTSGVQSLFIDIHHPSFKQTTATIPILLEVTSIEIIPKSLDFEKVYPTQTYSQSVQIIQSGNIKHPVRLSIPERLKDILSVPEVAPESIKVKLKPGKAPAIDEVGLNISIPALEFNFPMPVRFIPLRPDLRIEIDNNGSTCEKWGYSTTTVSVVNTGNAHLSATVKPLTSYPIGINKTNIGISPGKESKVGLLFFNADLKEEVCLPIIEILPQDNGLKSIQLNGRFQKVEREARLCPDCQMISPHEILYCTFCGHSLSEEPPYTKKEVAVCQLCHRIFDENYAFCPDDGKQLLKKSKEETLAVFRMSKCRLPKK
jgi:RNA polymerase subunit RPABC4/transcription elongation factor Spt4